MSDKEPKNPSDDGLPDNGVVGVVEPTDELVTPVLDGQIRSGKLAGKTLTQAIIILAAPVFFEHLLGAMVGLVDIMLTGGLGEISTPALDAVSIGSYVGWFIGIAVSSLGIGSQALIARSLGRGDTHQANHGLGQAAGFSIGWGILIAVTLYAAAPVLATIGGLSEEARHYCVQYVRTHALGVPFASFMFIGIMSLHGAGEMVKPFYVMVVVNLVNISASWYFSGATISLGHWTFQSPGGWGVVGIATGTVLAHASGALLILLLMIRGVKDLRLHWWSLPIYPELLWRIIRIGVPSFAEGMGMWIGNLLVIGVVGLIARAQAIEGITREGLMGAHIITVQWEAFSFLPGFAMGIAAATLAGQYLGAGNPRMATQGIFLCTAIAMAFMSVAGIALCLWGEPLTRLISNDPLHLELVPKLLFICGLIQANFALAMVLRTGMRGAGDTRWAMIITWSSTYLIRLPAAYILGYQLEYGLIGVWIALNAEIVFRSLLFLARFLHGGWRHIRV
ncbi:MAG: MATE family efflux transporter [Planctomycetaceae bacterium]|nr:MAG: MATE family efflux transporter [Planctomycetaceae bacterium]